MTSTATSATVALAGCPNSGKSALFNALTGARQKVGNYPGVTVEKKIGSIKSKSGFDIAVIDLPGTYSLHPHSPDEEIAVKVLLNNQDGVKTCDLVVAVADATNLERTLGLAIELKKLGYLAILAINMMDLAEKRGLKLNLEKLSEKLSVPVIPTVAVKEKGISELIEAIEKTLSSLNSHPRPRSPQEWNKPTASDLIERAKEVQELLNYCVSSQALADKWTERLDRIFLHHIFGGPILAIILLCMFQAVFSWAETPMELIENSIALLAEKTRNVLPDGLLASLITDGVIAGVGSVLVFLPQILILFFFIFLLEGSGYMMRAAFIMDRLMAAVGLQGRSFVPLLSSFACAIPGIMATRTIKNERDRLITMMIAPLMTCSARLPVYVLIIGAFIPNHAVLGPLKLQGLVMFGLFLLGIVTAMIVAWVSKKIAPQKIKTPVIFDLPTYKWPCFKNIGWSLWHRATLFIKKAGKFILVLSVILWVLATFPRPPADWQQPAINYSLAGRIGHFIEPIVAPIGFDWRIATGLIPGFAAREVMVGSLGTVFAVENVEETEGSLQTLQEKIAAAWSLPTGLSLLVWYVFAPQCISTFAIMRRESNSWKFTGISFAYLLALAYLASLLTFHLFSWIL